MPTKTKTNISREELLELFDVDTAAGVLRWRSPTKAAACRTGQAGCVVATGYRVVQVRGSNYFAHRLIWLAATGAWPSGEIDHINGNKADNRLENLRDVPKRVNKQNLRRAYANNESGLLGAHRFKNRWSSHINVNGRNITIGYFDTPEEAHQAYVEYKRRLHVGNTL